MRKRNVKFLADTIFWYLLYFLPVLSYLVYMLVEPGSGGTIIPFDTFLGSGGFSVLTNNIVFETLDGLFGSTGILPLFQNSGVLMFCSYFICVYLIHLAVDVVLFIPRFAHKFLSVFQKDGEE